MNLLLQVQYTSKSQEQYDVSTSDSKYPNYGKFPHSPIPHYAFSSCIEKTVKKKPYIFIGKQICLQ